MATGKAYRIGTERLVHPEETLARLRPLAGAFGVTRVANLTGLDRAGIPVVMVCRPNARLTAVFHGKGVELAAAKASGLMEAIETWHAEHVDLPLRFGSARELGARVELGDVAGLPRLAARTWRDDLPLLWVEGRDLSDRRPLWLPYEIVHADATVGGPPASRCFAASTNGLASGNHFLEAVSHGLCEVIERDATSLWHRLSPPLQDARRLDLLTVDDDVCRRVLDRLEGAGIAVAVWETTTEVGVPAFQCLVVDRGATAHVGHGAGCHPTREVALARALTEAVQVRMTYIAGSREDLSPADYQRAALEARCLRARAMLRPVERMRRFFDAGRFAFATFAEDVGWILGRLRAAGFGQAVAVDLSRAEFGVAVARVVVPGLEGSDHHAGYSPGPRARALLERRP